MLKCASLKPETGAASSAIVVNQSAKRAGSIIDPSSDNNVRDRDMIASTPKVEQRMFTSLARVIAYAKSDRGLWRDRSTTDLMGGDYALRGKLYIIAAFADVRLMPGFVEPGIRKQPTQIYFSGA